LLTEAPRDVPLEAQDELRLAMEKRRRQGAMLGSTLPVVLGACIPLMLHMGVRDYRPFIAFYVVVFVFMVSCLVVLRTKRPNDEMVLALAALNLVPYLALGLAFGPLFVVPSFCIMNIVVFQLYLVKYRALIIALATVPLLAPLPFGLPYRFGPSGMLIEPRMLDLANGGTAMGLVLLLNLVAILVTGVVVARDRITLLAAEQQLIVNAWQLRQVLPQVDRE
jgi:hypothetical protein